MNFILGLVVGVFLSIGIAYVHDATISGPDRDARALVNWTAFDAEVRSTSESISGAWDRLMGAMPRREEAR